MKLTILSGPRTGTEVALHGTCVVGREADCILVLDADPKISRRHAAFETLGDGGVQVRDLGSANGTFVDGVQISAPVRLHGNEVVMIGTTSFRVAGEVPAAAAADRAPEAVHVAAVALAGGGSPTGHAAGNYAPVAIGNLPFVPPSRSSRGLIVGLCTMFAAGLIALSIVLILLFADTGPQ